MPKAAKMQSKTAQGQPRGSPQRHADKLDGQAFTFHRMESRKGCALRAARCPLCSSLFGPSASSLSLSRAALLSA